MTTKNALSEVECARAEVDDDKELQTDNQCLPNSAVKRHEQAVREAATIRPRPLQVDL